ncbi:enoyl-CoA hydratase/isomerase family protein [Bradyrhizobium sp. U87765 SZCCT0131]|uniref:enoyl-CoA hydratase n=1 Tax=unclassified Bradyrhizobium TaxID=2631580 RepID=UPI001BA576CC|nr:MULTISPECIES: enoyl-CoA hydratase [unclassified Bradyrhizobium]MBR1220669.1 enoyl-CoA hydratase/isomerase family protein [Bradyrhizobium sp. U87765 SZCCT0131]MBR1262877.1 enoyl-CoA hydratase/isomerase family protein [Bradyrhizobium sp. U87765 SZCCT0134]MBR1307241.1 enoyl-CoA hydratase/isomerase family protein [Bradyrhizobium sp. U87765 SZCCT0110]MBR1322872.1 enoyl-CoA hydratase/isomerase family protein [Bradyrhizobium sp. U87765 SZCCT0109]MBR1346195.1 enoyl-CoA hydratase/isomerase family pr
MDIINEFCGVEIDGRGVTTLTMRNAGRLNILDTPAITGLRMGLETLAKNDAIRVLVFRTESERAFIGGADIKEMARLDQASAETFITGLGQLCETVRQFPAPVIARIPGWCLGGGLEVAAACDFRVATATARFAMPEVKVGIPSVIHAALLPRLIGSGRARWLVMTGATIDATMARDWGFLDVVTTPDGLDGAIADLADELLGCGQQALRAQKELCRQWDELPLHESIQNSVAIFGRAFLTGEPQQHMQAFIDRKRTAT